MFDLDAMIPKFTYAKSEEKLTSIQGKVDLNMNKAGHQYCVFIEINL